MGLLERLIPSQPTEARYSWQQYVNDMMSFQGNQYPLGGTPGSNPEYPDATFADRIEKIHRQNGIVAAAVQARSLPMSQLRPMWQRTSGEERGELFEGRGLYPLSRPAGGTPNRFFKLLEHDVSYGGTGFVVRDGRQLRRLLPDRCGVVLGSNVDPSWNAEGDLEVPYDAEVIGLLYYPEGPGSRRATVFTRSEFEIYAPEPDPVYFWRGVSWVSSVVREIVVDNQMVDHQSKFFQNASTPNLVFLMDPSKSPEELDEFAALTKKLHTGPANAYRNMFLGGGTDVKVVGSTLKDLNVKDLSGGMETRVALRSRVPGVILGVREGYSGSSLNAGNYGQARRMFTDGWFAPTADDLLATLSSLLNVPDESRLTYDPDAVLLLQEDRKDAADILSTKAATMRTLIDGGFEPDTVVKAVDDGALRKLVHTGNVSVQLQPPNSGDDDPEPNPASDTEDDA